MRKLLAILLLISTSFSFAQEVNWDNNMYTSNKVSYGSESWKHSAEFQTRYKDNLGELEQWHLEYAVTYLYKRNWEITPDYRITRKPDHIENRPGLGILYKQLLKEKKTQLIHQVKYQYDFRNGPPDSHGLRYGFFFNYLLAEDVLLSGLIGGLFEFGSAFNGFLGMRTGGSLAYIFNEAHTINVGYYYGLVNDRQENYSNLGIISIQLVININKDYKYLPAKFYSF